MFRSNATRIAQRISDVLDDMLLGDFDYVDTDAGLYADIDYDHAYGTHLAAPDSMLVAVSTPASGLLRSHRPPVASRIARRPSGIDCPPAAAALTPCPGKLPEQWETTSRGNAA
jgi:hypothetical protein